MHKGLRILFGLLLLLLLVMVRAFEGIFNDPFIVFFKQDYLNTASPAYNFWSLLLSHSIRYLINALLSLGILYCVFMDRSIVRFSVLFYVLAFLILFPIYYISLSNLTEGSYQLTFYTRRFLIQPLFLFLLIPAFYYKKTILKKDQ